MKEKIHSMITESINVKSEVLKQNLDAIEDAAEAIIKAYLEGNSLYTCGNGGSACDSMHFAEELVARYKMNRPALPAMALSDASVLTCAGNDFGYDTVFSRQIEAHGKRGDILVALSTSGNSQNIIEAVKKAREKGMVAIGMSGGSGGAMKEFCEISINIPSTNSARIQESHITIIHCLCELIEDKIFGGETE